MEGKDKFLEIHSLPRLNYEGTENLNRLIPVPVQSLSRVRLCATPETAAHKFTLSMEFSRQEYWSGLPFPLQRIFLTQGSNLGLLHCRQILYHLSHHRSPLFSLMSLSKDIKFVYLF